MLSERLLSFGLDVELCCPSEELHVPEAATFLSELEGKLSIRDFPGMNSALSTLQGARVRLNVLAEVAKSSRAQTVYVPYADGLSQAWGLTIRCGSLMPSDVKFEGLMMRGTYAYPTRTFVESVKVKLSLKAQERSPWDRLHHLDAVAFAHLPSFGNLSRDRLIPEPIDAARLISKEQARTTLMLDMHETIITCPGGVSSTKGCDRLAEAMSLLDSQVDARLVLLGRHSNSVKAAVRESSHPDRILSIDRFATSHEFDCLFAAADVIAICYPRHIGSASILLRAAAYKKHIIASNWGWVGWAANEFSIGQTVDCNSIESIAEGLTRIIKLTTDHDEPVHSEKLKTFLDYHTPENHTAHWVLGICERMGISPPNLVPHPSVSGWRSDE